ncbi:MAG: hypothetical protein MKZ99_07800, partial [Candidatus Marinimicrobia bacterium]|nr:hypothetical protein [Candidatus Neomarinimicrobiota bacterium]
VTDKRAYIITGDEIEVNITDDLAAGEYNAFNRIEFIPMDTSGNIGNSARTFQVEGAAILDPGYATFSGATVADSNFYIDVYFDEGVYGDENAQTGLSDNALIIGIIVPFNGTATAISIDSLKNYTGAELIGGEDTIRVFLNVTGTPNGLENIEIFATSNSTVFDQSGTFTPATYSMSQAVGGRYLRDLTGPALELIDISGNTVAGMKYVAVNTPTLTITAEDAKSIEVDALSLTCTVNGNPVIINPIVITSEVATVIEFVTELADTVFTFGDIIFTVTDTAGNSTTLSPATFTVDTGDPANPEIGSLSTIVNSVAGWWNADNVAIDITVILPTDSTLLGGTIQLKAKVGSGDYEDLGSSVDIQINDFNDLDGNGIWNSDEPLDTITTTIIATEVDPLVGIEEINGFAEDVVITISAVIFDRATNPNIEIVTADIDSYGELINVDQVDPVADTVGAITSFSNDPVNSTSVDYYWNMDTDTITVTIDLPEDESLEGGSVQLKGKIGLSNFVNMGTLSSISANEFGDGELELKTITVPDSITGLDNGVEELVADFTAQDGSEIIIKAVVRDVAGNETTWTPNTTGGDYDGAVKIDLTPATLEITSETLDGWYMVGDTVNIQLQASEPILINSVNRCVLSTGGLAQYVGQGSNTRIHNFNYIVGVNETSAADTNSVGVVDGRLEVVGIIPYTDDEEQWVEGIQDFAGNYTPHSWNGVFYIPPPNTFTSLDDQNELHIDGVSPAVFPSDTMISYKAIGGTSQSARPAPDASQWSEWGLWEFDNGIYWNSTHTGVQVTIGLDETDESLASGNDKGSIQLKASSNPAAVLDEYENIGNETDIEPNSVTSGLQVIELDKNTLEGIAGFTDGSHLRMTALVKDI